MGRQDVSPAEKRHAMAKIPERITVEKTEKGDIYMTFSGKTESYTFGVSGKAASELLDAMQKAVMHGESVQ